MIKNILIFYISKNSGHYHAAFAIEKGLLEIAPDLNIEKIDAITYTNPILGRIVNKTYLGVIKKKPEFWGEIYDNPDVVKKTEKAREVIHKFNMPKIKRLFDKFSPDAVFCTQAFPCGMIADYKKLNNLNIPLIGVLTDYAPHSYWLFDEVDYYVVPSAETADVLAGKGVSRDKLRVLGIPVDPKFGRNSDINNLRKKLGLSAIKPTVLIMGGSQGLGAVEDAVASLAGCKAPEYQLIVVTGSNKKLYRRLERVKKKGMDNICLLAYVDNIDELMEASDCLVTKAGGLTTAEALVKHLPMIIVSPIPGQERMNTDYLVKKNVAVEVTDADEICRKVTGLFESDGLIGRMKENVKILAKPDSAAQVARLAFEWTGGGK